LPAQQQEHPMPPHQTNLTSGTPRNDVALGPDLSIALTAARSNAPVAALDGASSEKDAAGSPAAPTRSILSLLKRYRRAFQQSRRRQKLRACLHGLSERELMDIGVAPGEIEYIVAHQAIARLRDSATLLWLSRGVM
jgi:uncharacterized protein YjiS (DUF1127 family)